MMKKISDLFLSFVCISFAAIVLYYGPKHILGLTGYEVPSQSEHQVSGFYFSRIAGTALYKKIIHGGDTACASCHDSAILTGGQPIVWLNGTAGQYLKGGDSRLLFVHGDHGGCIKNDKEGSGNEGIRKYDWLKHLANWVQPKYRLVETSIF